MCGATLLQAAPAPQAQAAARPTPAAAPVPVRPAAPSTPPRGDTPVSGGPSFLGLNQPAPRTTRPSSGNPLSIDPNAAPGSRNLDYLLEDDEEPKRGGAAKYVLILV